jgi:uncharacterized protein (DUF885 family)
MKISSVLLLSATFVFAACSNNNTSKESPEKKSDTTSQTVSNVEPAKGGSVNDVVSAYLNLKNALTNDNGNEAASAAKEMGEALSKVDDALLTPEQRKVYADVKDDIKEHSEHIASNGSNIPHQREHFDLLSQDMIDLVKATGSTQTLYRDFCPMYNNKKGASWLSETKDIKNPYLGKEMPKCGEVKEEIKAKG